jgi:hypothetical protein
MIKSSIFGAKFQQAKVKMAMAIREKISLRLSSAR